MKNSTSVKTIIRKDKVKSDGMSPLYLSVIVNSKQLRLPVGKDWYANQWGSKTDSYPKGLGSATLKKLLENKEQKVKDFINKVEMLGEPLTFDKIKEFYNGVPDNKKDFYFHLDKFFKRKFKTICEGTQNHYLLFKKQLKEYKPSLMISEIDYNFLDGFFFYLSDEKNVGNSGLATRRKTFISVLEEFRKLRLIEKNHCKDIPRYKENVKTTFLTKKEIEKIVKADLNVGPKSRGLNISRDMFLFSCYTGLRFSDVHSLTVDEVKNNTVVKITQKTKSIVKIPLNKEAIDILVRCNYKRKLGKIFPRRCNVSVNRDLKRISKISKIDNTKILTFHVARHTFGSTLANEGVQPFYIMKLMGHADVRMTSRYVNSDEDILEKVMKKVSFKSA